MAGGGNPLTCGVYTRQELREEGSGDAASTGRLLLTPELLERAMFARLSLGQNDGETLLQYLLGCLPRSPTSHPTLNVLLQQMLGSAGVRTRAAGCAEARFSRALFGMPPQLPQGRSTLCVG